MALDLQLPILPVTINGTREVLPAGTLQLTPGDVHVTIHAAIPVQGFSETDLDDLAHDSRRIIASALRGERAPALSRT